MLRAHYLPLTILLTIPPALAQPPQEQMRSFPGFNMDGDISGHVIFPRGMRLSTLFVEIQQVGSNNYIGKVPVSGDGEFHFSGPPAATYRMRVTNMDGTVLVDDMATAGMGIIEIRLPEVAAHAIGGTVSLFELQHKIPSNALKEAREADKLYKKHDVEGYIDHVRKAIAIDPDYLMAHRNLGIILLQTGRNEEAIQQFQEVLKRNPRALEAYSAIGSAYLQMEKYSSAEAAARRALGFDPAFEPGNYILGLSLDLQGKDDSEALEHLEKVSSHYPKAHLVEAKILERLGQKEQAKAQLESYLATGSKEIRSQVKNWLSSLN